MKLFEIALPVKDNAGKDMNGAHIAFQTIAMTYAGGYTKRPSGEGAWRDDETGRIYYDRMIPYRVACDEETLERLLDDAHRLFPDQISLAVTFVGYVHFHNRPTNLPRSTPDRAFKGQGKRKLGFGALVDDVGSGP